MSEAGSALEKKLLQLTRNHYGLSIDSTLSRQYNNFPIKDSLASVFLVLWFSEQTFKCE